MSKIGSEADLRGEELKIGWHLSQLRLDAVLLGIRVYDERVNRFEFVRAGLAAFAVRYCRMPDRQRDATPLAILSRLAHRVALYLLTDPITFDEGLRDEFNASNPAFVLLRIQASQQPFYSTPYGAHIRALVLYEELPHSLILPTGVPHFPLDERFSETTDGVGIADFIRVGIVAFAAAAAHPGFTLDYFRQARLQHGVALPEDEVIVRVLQQITADPEEFRNQHQRLLTPDRRFAMYDFNPLLSRPIIRPWTTDGWTGARSPRMTAPVPELIAARLSGGIYHQLFARFGTAFSDYFGYLFEAYCGRVLAESRSAQQLLSEQEIRTRFPSWQGKVPDWFWIDGTAAIAFECKATRFTRAAMATGEETAVADSLRQVRKGLGQLAEFRTGCESGAPGLEAFAGLTILPVLITPEPMYGINSGFFREYLDAQLAEAGVPAIPWRVVSVTELEALQPHVAAGLRMEEEIERWAGRLDGNAVAELESRTGRSVEDSFLHRYHEDMLSSLRRASPVD